MVTLAPTLRAVLLASVLVASAAIPAGRAAPGPESPPSVSAAPSTGTRTVAACPAQVEFDDEFHDATGGWEPADELRFGQPNLKVVIGDGTAGFSDVNENRSLRDGTLCLDIAMPNLADREPSAGIIFRAKDDSDFYVAEIDGTGHVSIYHNVNDDWTELYWGDATAVDIKPGATNTLRVDLNGDDVTVAVNGVQQAARSIPFANAGDRFGLYVQVQKPPVAPETLTFDLLRFRMARPAAS